MSRSCPDVAPGKSTPVLQRNSSFDDGGGFYLRRGETGNVLEKQTRMADLFVRDFSWVTVNSGIVPQFARVVSDQASSHRVSGAGCPAL